MIKKLKIVVSVFALAIMSMSVSASAAEEIEIGSFRNVVTGINADVKVTTTNIDVQQKVGWKFINGQWYYFNESGVMQTGWLSDNGKWYYLNSLGAMMHDTVIDGYTLNTSGALITQTI